MDRLIVSVGEAAELFGVSDDLIYELTERGDVKTRYPLDSLTPVPA
jgi:hypothetical protein